MAEPRTRAFSDTKAIPTFPGATRRTLVSGDNQTLVRIEIEQDHTVPEHVHPHEQVGTVIAGRISITIQEQTTIIESGGSYLIPGDLPHSVTALEPTTLIECFAPVRDEFAHD